MAVNIRPSLQRALRQLHAERSRIDRQISALTDAIGAIGAGARRARGAAKRVVKRARRKLTAAQRKAVSKRMRAYWAAKRKAKAS